MYVFRLSPAQQARSRSSTPNGIGVDFWLMLVCLSVLWSVNGWAGVAVANAAGGAEAPRVALIIGNADYRDLPKLLSSVRDARAVGDTLNRAGYSVSIVENGTQAAIREALGKFAAKAERSEVAIVYFAGTGYRIEGNDFIAATDTASDKDRLALAGVAVEEFVRSVEGAARLGLVIVDACRENTPEPKRAITRSPRDRYRSEGFDRHLTRDFAEANGVPAYRAMIEEPPEYVPVTLTRMPQALDVVVLYSTEPGSLARDGNSGLSPFAAAFVDLLQSPGVVLGDFLPTLRDRVIRDTQGFQRPYFEGSWGTNAPLLTPALVR